MAKSAQKILIRRWHSTVEVSNAALPFNVLTHMCSLSFRVKWICNQHREGRFGIWNLWGEELRLSCWNYYQVAVSISQWHHKENDWRCSSVWNQVPNYQQSNLSRSKLLVPLTVSRHWILFKSKHTENSGSRNDCQLPRLAANQYLSCN